MVKKINSEHNTNKGKKTTKRPLRTKKEIEFVQSYLTRGNSKFGKRNELIFLVGINTGLRCSDIVKLKVGEVTGDRKPLITEQKTGKQRRLNLSNLGHYIDTYLELALPNAAPDDWLFPSGKFKQKHITRPGIYQVFNAVGKDLGLEDFATHTMRKTFGYHYYKQTHDVVTLMKIFNHSSEEMTKRYIDITMDEVAESLNSFSLGAEY